MLARPTAVTTSGARLRRPPQLRAIQLGELRLTYIPDGYVLLKPSGWLPGTTDADWSAYAGDFADHLDPEGYLVAGLGALLVQLGRRGLLIEAGAGPLVMPAIEGHPMNGEMRSGALVDSLALVEGLDSVEAVAITHLHFDHLGWTLPPAAARTPFATAPIYVGEVEWAWWRSLTPAMVQTLPEWAKPGVLTRPILDTIAERVQGVHDGESIFPGVRALALPGHTTGHIGYELRSGGQRMLVFGDVFHSPVQITHPGWAIGADYDQADGIAHREQLVGELADSGDLAFGVHFADVPFGRVIREPGSDRTRWVAAD
ncbi:MBL fold metallo-hydrolase [Nocardia takedensis]|uniref:MBL fold metallo-hydrolase n=1 Tax=Nocardia takedensis TaxID=259390 RepID=UPI003F76CE69